MSLDLTNHPPAGRELPPDGTDGKGCAYCGVCGDGCPLDGPTPEMIESTCPECLALGYTGADGDDVRRAIGG